MAIKPKAATGTKVRKMAEGALSYVVTEYDLDIDIDNTLYHKTSSVLASLAALGLLTE